jgi:hypothetical protein
LAFIVTPQVVEPILQAYVFISVGSLACDQHLLQHMELQFEDHIQKTRDSNFKFRAFSEGAITTGMSGA